VILSNPQLSNPQVQTYFIEFYLRSSSDCEIHYRSRLANMFKPQQPAVEEIEDSAAGASASAAPAAEGSAAPRSPKDSKVLRLDTETRKRK
jgi:hypothetical protein